MKLLSWKKVKLQPVKQGSKVLQPLSEEYTRRAMGKLLSKIGKTDGDNSSSLEDEDSDDGEEKETVCEEKGNESEAEHGESGAESVQAKGKKNSDAKDLENGSNEAKDAIGSTAQNEDTSEPEEKDEMEEGDADQSWVSIK